MPEPGDWRRLAEPLPCSWLFGLILDELPCCARPLISSASRVAALCPQTPILITVYLVRRVVIHMGGIIAGFW